VKKRKGGTCNFGISELRVSGFQMSNNNVNISRSFEKVRWDLKFWDFGTRGFGIYEHMLHKHKRKIKTEK
jgi:hypothetical protein